MVDDTTSGGGDKKRLCVEHKRMPVSIELPLLVSSEEAENFHLKNNFSTVAAAVARWHAEDPLDSLPVEEFSIRAHATREHKVGCL